METPLPENGVSLEPPILSFHLSGGLILMLGASRIAVLMSPGGPGFVIFSLLPGTTITQCLRDQTGLRILGKNYFRLAQEMNEPVNQFFFISASDPTNHCLAHSQGDHWSGVNTALHAQKRHVDALLASRVTSQIRLCVSRLERLSVTYRNALPFVVRNLDTKHDISVTSDKYAHAIEGEYRSCLNELYSLRDALLAAAHKLLFKNENPFTMNAIKQAVGKSETQTAKLISSSMFDAKGDLLIDRMSLYRSVSQHCIGSTNPVLDSVYQIKLSKGPLGEIPYIVFPLYDDVVKLRAIEQGASKGTLERPDREEAKEFLKKDNFQDGLEFCYDCFERLLRIGEALGNELGIKPEIVNITDEEIISLKYTDEKGNVIKARKDPATGKLVQE